MCTDGLWLPNGPCLDEGECTAGELEVRDAAMCAEETRLCSATCTWGIWNVTTAPGECEPGMERFDEADCGDAAYRAQTCSATCAWENTSECTRYLEPCQLCARAGECVRAAECVYDDSSGDVVCLPLATEDSDCPRGRSTVRFVAESTASEGVCYFLGNPCCLDVDVDRHGVGMGCLGPDCWDSDPDRTGCGAGDQGVTCSATSECGGGLVCAEGICCETGSTGCTGPCESCHVFGSRGRCAPIPGCEP